jgi:hypothetical protein
MPMSNDKFPQPEVAADLPRRSRYNGGGVVLSHVFRHLALRDCNSRGAYFFRPRILNERGYFNRPCRSVDGFRRCWFVPIVHPWGTTAIFTDRMTVPSLPRRVTLRGSAPVLTDNDSRMCGSPTTLCYVESCALSEMDGGNH